MFRGSRRKANSDNEAGGTMHNFLQFAIDTSSMNEHPKIQNSFMNEHQESIWPVADAKDLTVINVAKPSPILTASDVSPQDYLDALVFKKGYSIKRYSTLDSGYMNEPTALQEASYRDHVIDLVKKDDLESFRALLNCGLSNNPSNYFGQSLIHFVCRAKKVDFLRVMMEFGCDVSIVDCTGRTPLHEACKSRTPCFHLIRILANKDIRMFYMTDANSATPLKYAPRNCWAKWNRFFDTVQNFYWPGRDVRFDEPPPPLALLKPNSRTIPDLKTKLDLQVIQKLASGDLLPSQVAPPKLEDITDRTESETDFSSRDNDMDMINITCNDRSSHFVAEKTRNKKELPKSKSNISFAVSDGGKQTVTTVAESFEDTAHDTIGESAKNFSCVEYEMNLYPQTESGDSKDGNSIEITPVENSDESLFTSEVAKVAVGTGIIASQKDGAHVYQHVVAMDTKDETQLSSFGKGDVDVSGKGVLGYGDCTNNEPPRLNEFLELSVVRGKKKKKKKKSDNVTLATDASQIEFQTFPVKVLRREETHHLMSNPETKRDRSEIQVAGNKMQEECAALSVPEESNRGSSTTDFGQNERLVANLVEDKSKSLMSPARAVPDCTNCKSMYQEIHFDVYDRPGNNKSFQPQQERVKDKCTAPADNAFCAPSADEFATASPGRKIGADAQVTTDEKSREKTKVDSKQREEEMEVKKISNRADIRSSRSSVHVRRIPRSRNFVQERIEC